MTAAAPFLAALGGIVFAAGVAMFISFRAGVRGGTRSANLEYGIAPAVPAALGLWLVDLGLGWPGLPGAAYVLAWLGLAVLFTAAILRR